MSLYEWVENWAELPQDPLGWAHAGVAVTQSGDVLTCHPAEPALLVYDANGNLTRTTPLAGLLEPHGFALAGNEMWIDDVGFKRHVSGAEFETERAQGRVVLADFTGRIVRELDPRPDWSPTAIALVEETGDLWIADGYGEDLVHRFDRDGRLVATLDGEEGAGRFKCPHGVLVDTRRAEPELYVADRANGRIQVYDLEGNFRRVVGEGVVVTPTDMTLVGDALALTDFTQARVTILDANDELIEHVGANPEAPEREGWPNARDADGNLVRPPLESGRFNSPHTLAADASGNLYVTEWLLGGRLTKLARVR